MIVGKTSSVYVRVNSLIERLYMIRNLCSCSANAPRGRPERLLDCSKRCYCYYREGRWLQKLGGFGKQGLTHYIRWNGHLTYCKSWPLAWLSCLWDSFVGEYSEGRHLTCTRNAWSLLSSPGSLLFSSRSFSNVGLDLNICSQRFRIFWPIAQTTLYISKHTQFQMSLQTAWS